MKVKNMPERVERRRADAALRAGKLAVYAHIGTTDVTYRRGKAKRSKAARKFMGPKAVRE